MDIQRKEFEKWYFNENYKDTTACKLKVFEVLSGLVGVESPYNGTYLNYNVQTSWKVWQQAQKVAVPEGFVLVEKSKISYFYQDSDEPENFCSSESDFDSLGDCIDLGEIMEINKHTQAHIQTEKLFGTWFAEIIDPSEKANFFVGSHEECLVIIEKNKAMIEAQEQSE